MPSSADSPPRRPRAARHGSGPSARRSAPASRQTKRARIAGLLIFAVGVLVIGLASGFGSELSAEPTVQAFLLDWQQQHYAAAGALTSASPGTAAAGLKDAFAQLDATQLFLTMNSVTQHGGTAEASFTASVDLAEEGRVWAYHGRFGLSRVGGAWKVQWAPSVVYPGLGPGERLAVVTQFPDRASVLDAEGQPLQVPSLVYVVGVVPAALADPAATAQRFAEVTELEAGQVLGQITAAPPNQFLKLASLDPVTYSQLRSRLRGVPGLVVQRERARLFQAEATGLVGEVGSEIDPVLRSEGAFYLPGTTVGRSGLEQKYQRQLLGTPTTEVVAVTSAGDPDRRARALAGRGGHSGAHHDQLEGPGRGPGRAGRRVRFGGDRRRPGVHRRCPRGSAAPRLGRRAERQADAGNGVHHRVGRRAAGDRAEDRLPDLHARTPLPSTGGRSAATGPAPSSRSLTTLPTAAVRPSRGSPNASTPPSSTRW